ncbi:MAG: BBP7 family outer membrane beta-barrel protein [Planctomycetes bacterium]|nr:BBP7 family outer membrane beta-barrel protein [Planctomycetota bacterium]
MSIKHAKTWVIAWLLVLLAGSTAFGQGLQEFQLFKPADTGTYGKFFDPVDPMPYGDSSPPNEGFFVLWDGLIWSISSPNVSPIGDAGLVSRVVYTGPWSEDLFIQTNTHDTGAFGSRSTQGERIEFGKMTGHHGWVCSTFRLNSKTQSIETSDMDVVWIDDAFGPTGTRYLQGWYEVPGGDATADPPVPPIWPPDVPPSDYWVATNADGDPVYAVYRDLPVTYEDVLIQNRVETWSAELMYVYRTHRQHHGGYYELFGGVRYMEFDERFTVQASGGILDESVWHTNGENHIIGPQVGGRWFQQRGRWQLSVEGRFFAGINFQSVRQTGTLGTNLAGGVDAAGDPILGTGSEGMPRVLSATSFNSVLYEEEWSPGAELRAELKYKVTGAINLRVGWTGMYLDGIARPSGMVNYEIPTMGIRPDNNRQGIFVNGLTLGIELNR